MLLTWVQIPSVVSWLHCPPVLRVRQQGGRPPPSASPTLLSDQDRPPRAQPWQTASRRALQECPAPPPSRKSPCTQLAWHTAGARERLAECAVSIMPALAERWPGRDTALYEDPPVLTTTLTVCPSPTFTLQRTPRPRVGRPCACRHHLAASTAGSLAPRPALHRPARLRFRRKALAD